MHSTRLFGGSRNKDEEEPKDPHRFQPTLVSTDQALEARPQRRVYWAPWMVNQTPLRRRRLGTEGVTKDQEILLMCSSNQSALWGRNGVQLLGPRRFGFCALVGHLKICTGCQLLFLAKASPQRHSRLLEQLWLGLGFRVLNKRFSILQRFLGTHGGEARFFRRAVTRIQLVQDKDRMLYISRKVAPKGIPRVCLAKQVSARPGLIIDSSIQPPPPSN